MPLERAALGGIAKIAGGPVGTVVATPPGVHGCQVSSQSDIMYLCLSQQIGGSRSELGPITRQYAKIAANDTPIGGCDGRRRPHRAS